MDEVTRDAYVADYQRWIMHADRHAQHAIRMINTGFEDNADVPTFIALGQLYAAMAQASAVMARGVVDDAHVAS